MADDIRILLAERNQDLREQLALLLNSYEGLLVVGTAGSGTVAVELATGLWPDIILLDAELPIIDGFTAAKLIRQKSPHAIIIMICSAYVGKDQEPSLDNVNFILMKPTASETLVGVIRSLHANGFRHADANNSST